MAPAIELAGLGRAYGERTALSGVTLTLEPGRTLAVFGANGAGKTTLLRILATLLRPHPRPSSAPTGAARTPLLPSLATPLRPHAGRARVLGRELPGDGWAVRGRVG